VTVEESDDGTYDGMFGGLPALWDVSVAEQDVVKFFHPLKWCLRRLWEVVKRAQVRGWEEVCPGDCCG
jgi:hypothetical protein